jgi:dTDP-4-dehydrorhamnose 3,5-epimerase
LSPEIRASDEIAGVLIVHPRSHGDDRGRFSETYRRSWFPDGREMVQGNRSDKVMGSVVGLHYHRRQADYWYVLCGVARVVLHDLRIGSPTEGTTMTLEMGDGNDCGVYIPPGVAHGFAALTDLVVAWDDPDIGADWGVADPILSARDEANPRRADIPPGLRPRVEPASH